MKCRLEWDLQGGLMCGPMPTRTLACPILYGRGGVAGEVAGGEAGEVASAGTGLGRTCTIPGDRCSGENPRNER
jgi:hypothetical protein